MNFFPRELCEKLERKFINAFEKALRKRIKIHECKNPMIPVLIESTYVPEDKFFFISNEPKVVYERVE